jgi:hypothetical protein
VSRPSKQERARVARSGPQTRSGKPLSAEQARRTPSPKPTPVAVVPRQIRKLNERLLSRRQKEKAELEPWLLDELSSKTTRRW